MKPSIRLLFGLMIPLTLLVGCDKEIPVKKDIIRPAKLLMLGEANSASIRNFPGEVEASDQSVLAFRVAGELKKLPVKAGQKVEKGQLLAQLDPTDYQLQVDDRQARFDLAKVEYNRFKKMLEKKLVAISTVDQKKAQYLSTKSALDLAKQDLAYTKLTAPFAGVVSKVLVENHQNIQAQQVILHLQSDNVLTISFQLPESMIAHLNTEARDYQPVITFDANPGNTYLASYKEHSTEADPQTLSYEVQLEMEMPTDFNVLPGMTANVAMDMRIISTAVLPDYQIPSSAVFSYDTQTADSKVRNVWKIDPDNHTAHLAEVQVGQLTSAGIEVFGGLKPGDIIVTAGVTNIKEGMQVRPWERERGL
ncbi:efflux RND transporter periplasmic adaptor subunit [Litoribrevibacter albus]|uniref:Lipoprotein n=1 Tax=Litoribrevibacter albus TaxID=1473156 RepID=A0AA37SD64_9GAMM|nr:efflux RND transporter periplasmic adaptor subunit [Litoribrevibacter albus]GLQ33294.1 lipoprotein [Litoribrevibacter albus]